jgi:hypothetical protein
LKSYNGSAAILGACIFFGLAVFAYQLADAAISYKQLERSVTVKGLAEREVNADIVLWPIQFSTADNDLQALYDNIEKNTAKINAFLLEKGLSADEISFTSPTITDKSAQQWGTNAKSEFRYSAMQTVTVYSKKIAAVRSMMSELSQLGKQGIVFTGGNYNAQTEYIFTGLNRLKPEMIEESTRQARDVADKFAKDSQSKLGKIKRASQGQFSITARDKNNPQIKKLRVVSTVEYYLSD